MYINSAFAVSVSTNMQRLHISDNILLKQWMSVILVIIKTVLQQMQNTSVQFTPAQWNFLSGFWPNLLHTKKHVLSVNQQIFWLLLVFISKKKLRLILDVIYVKAKKENVLMFHWQHVTHKQSLLCTYLFLLVLCFRARQSDFQFDRPFTENVSKADASDLLGLSDNSVPGGRWRRCRGAAAVHPTSICIGETTWWAEGFVDAQGTAMLSYQQLQLDGNLCLIVVFHWHSYLLTNRKMYFTLENSIFSCFSRYYHYVYVTKTCDIWWTRRYIHIIAFKHCCTIANRKVWILKTNTIDRLAMACKHNY